MATPAINPVSAEAPPCSGFPADTYDRYVLGLLDSQERSAVDQQVEQQCPACIGGVQRSMNLWLVWAHSLEQTEPAADFGARLIRIAELSNRMLTIPKRHKRVREPALLISSLVIIGLILVALLIFTWVAGRQSAHMDSERANNELERTINEYADSKIKLQQQLDKNRTMERKLTPSGISDVTNQKKMEDSLSKAQAEVAQYKANLARELARTTDSVLLVDALSNPGVKLLTLKGAEGVAAYAFVIANAKVIFVASKLPPPQKDHHYQVWLVRKEEPRYVSAGVFSVTDGKPVLISYEQDKDLVANLSGVVVTEEPESDATAPTGPMILETPGAAPISTPAPTPVTATNLPTGL